MKDNLQTCASERKESRGFHRVGASGEAPPSLFLLHCPGTCPEEGPRARAGIMPLRPLNDPCYAAHDRVGGALSRSAVSCGSANCVRDAPQPQPHPQLSSPRLAVSDKGEGASIVKGSNVEVGMASPFRGRGKLYGSCVSEVSLPRH
jgi:hypothetical protein